MDASVYQELVLRQSTDVLCVLDASGRFVYVSPSVERILGCEPAEITGSSAFDFVHVQDVDAARQALAATLQGEEANLVFRLQRANGSWIRLQAVSTLSAGPRGPCVVICARDANDRQAAQAAWRASEDEYRRLFEDSRDAICIGTVDGSLVDVNPAGVKLFEYASREEMLSLNIGRDLYWNPEDRKRAEALFLAQGFVEDLELELRTRTGKRIIVQETASAIADKAGNIVGFRGILRDITEHRRLEEQLRQAQKMEAVGRLAGGVAHDFNNLLTSINGYSELLLARLPPDDHVRSALEEILQAGRRAASLTRRLLTLSRHHAASPRVLNLNRVVADMEKLLRRVISEDIHLEVRTDPQLGSIRVDPAQIEQVILNLAVNARDAMAQGGRLTLETHNVSHPSGRSHLVMGAMPGERPGEERMPGDYVQLVVRDTGIGMPDAVREHVFEPFFSTKDKGHNSGLGLAIVYGIVQQNGGFIEVESAEGQGSAFFLYFPLAIPASEPTLNPRTAEALPRGCETVLLVEDEDAVRTLVRQILEMLGYRVLEARDASTARELCAELGTAPALLLTDIVMPDCNGPELARELTLLYPQLKTLFMSGYSDSHNGVQRFAESGGAFLAKPFSPIKLAYMARAVLDSTAADLSSTKELP